MENRLHISFIIPSLGSGGAERVISILASQLAERGNTVDVVMISNRHQDYKISDKVNIIYLDCDQDQQLQTGKRYLLRLQKIRKTIKNTSPDLVISFMSETNIDVCFAMKGMKIPLIVSERNDPKIDPPSRAKQLLRRIAYRKPAGFVFQTPDAQAYFSKRIQKRSTIILNPISEDLPPRHTGDREKRIVAVGRLNKQKNFPLLIHAFADFVGTHPDYVLEIYGKGSLRDKLASMLSAESLTDKVLLKGFCNDVHQRIVSAAMFVMSSDFEGMPNALAEAMAIGMPSISTDCPCGGPKLLIEHGENGLLVPVGDQGKMLEAMIYMADHPDAAEQMSQKACDVKNKMDVNAITMQWERFIDQCCGK